MTKKRPKHGLSVFSLADRILYIRQERRRMTQAELAKASGVSQSTIAQIEKGHKDPSITTLRKIAEALDVHVAVLFASDDVHVFDMKRLKSKYDHVDKLNPTIYSALGRVVSWAKQVGFI